MGVEVLDGQRLHVGEHLVADALLGALGDAGCEQALNEHGHDTGGKGGGHLENERRPEKSGSWTRSRGLMWSSMMVSRNVMPTTLEMAETMMQIRTTISCQR